MNKPLKWHGGKHFLANQILALMPPHQVYVEPYAGGLSVMLKKNPEGVAEFANDLNRDLANFWQVLRDPIFFAAFQRLASVTPFAEFAFDEAKAAKPIRGYPLEVSKAFHTFCRYRLSIGGRGKDFCPGSQELRAKMNRDSSAWLNCIDGLREVHDRISRIFFYCRDALEVIDLKDRPETLIYCDPPYLLTTRTTPTYDCEMSERDHAALLDRIRNCKAKVMISGYESKLYSESLQDWNRHEFTLANHASRARKKREMTEVLWCNF